MRSRILKKDIWRYEDARAHPFLRPFPGQRFQFGSLWWRGGGRKQTEVEREGDCFHWDERNSCQVLPFTLNDSTHTHTHTTLVDCPVQSSPGWGDSGDTSTTPLTSLTTQSPLCLPNPLPSTPQWFPVWCQQKASWPSCWGWRHHTGGCPGWVCVDSGSMGRDEGEGGCILASATTIFFFPLPPPQTPSFLWFYGLLTGSRLSSGYERRSLADLLQRFWQGLQEKKALQHGDWAGPDDPGGEGTCRFWGNLTPPGGPLRCERWACKTV